MALLMPPMWTRLSSGRIFKKGDERAESETVREVVVLACFVFKLLLVATPRQIGCRKVRARSLASRFVA